MFSPIGLDGSQRQRGGAEAGPVGVGLVGGADVVVAAVRGEDADGWVGAPVQAPTAGRAGVEPVGQRTAVADRGMAGAMWPGWRA